jgi:hypothetical protein
MPTFHAGCGLYGLLGQAPGGEAANQTIETDCSYAGNGETSNDYRVNFSVGDQMYSALSVAGDYWKWYGLSQSLANESGRFTFTWSGGLLNKSGTLDANTTFASDGTAVSGGWDFTAPSSSYNSQYSESVTITDTWSGQSQTFPLTIEQNQVNCSPIPKGQFACPQQ